MTDNKTDQQSETEQKATFSERLKLLFDAYIFPGKLFPCYRPRVGEDGEKLPPPTLDELLRFEADNAKGKFNPTLLSRPCPNSQGLTLATQF